MFNKTFLRSSVLLLFYTIIIIMSLPIAKIFKEGINSTVYYSLTFFTYIILILIWVTLIIFLFWNTPVKIFIGDNSLYINMVFRKIIINKNNIKSIKEDDNGNKVIMYQWNNKIREYTINLITKELNKEVNKYIQDIHKGRV